MSRKPSLVPNPHALPEPPKALSPTLAGRPVRRRDFLNGLLVGATGALIGTGAAGCDDPLYTKPIPEPIPLPPGEDKGDDHTVCHMVRDGQVWDIPAASGDVYDCVVIGGGISGLCAAWRLQKLGAKKVLVLEKDAAVGGFARLDGPAESAWGQAAAYTVFPYNDNLIEVYTELGVITGLDPDGDPILDPKYLLQGPVNSANISGKWYAEPWDTGLDALPYDEALKADLRAFRDNMLAWYDYAGPDGKTAFDTPSDASTTEERVRALDDISFADYITTKFDTEPSKSAWSAEVAEFYTPYCRSAFGTTPDKLSAWAAINFFGSEFQPSLSQPGGNAYLAQKFAEKVGADNIVTGAFVLRVKNDADKVLVSYLVGDAVKTIQAKAAVYAGPRYLAKYVLPDLVAANRNEAKDFQYTPYIVANVHVSATPEGIGYDNWIHGVETIFTDIIVADWAGLADPTAAPLDRANTLTCYCPLTAEGARPELLSKPFEEYEKLILDDLEKVFPGLGATVTGVDLYRWGHAMLTAGPGFVFGASRVGSQAAEGLISFACHDVDGLPAFENAVASAYRASGEVATVLGL